MKNVVVGMLTILLVCTGVSHAAFTWSQTGTMVYDGTGVDSGINPYVVSNTVDTSGDINLRGSLTVQSGSLTINPATSWGDKIGNGTGNTGTVVINGGSLTWVVDNDNEDRLMVANGNGTANVTLNGGSFIVNGPGGYDHAERNVRFGSDGGLCNLTLNAGTLNITINIPVAFGGKWTVNGTVWVDTASPTANPDKVSTMIINNGSFVSSGGSIFGVGSNDKINFLTGGTGMLSIKNWTSTQFLALATAGKLQVDGVGVTDLSGFIVTDGTPSSQGTLTLNSKVKVIAPTNNAVNVLTTQDLSWQVLDTNVTYVDLWFGTDPNFAGHPAEKVLSHVAKTTISYDTGTLAYSTPYYWRVDAYEPNGLSEKMTVGGTWSFTTVGQAPSVSAVNPSLSMVDGNGTINVSMLVEGVNVTAYQWYKIGTLTDIQLTNGTKYAGVTTNTLTINGVVQADEGYYYCSVRNTVYPDAVTNKTTGPGQLMTRRLMSYYPMEVINVVDGNDVTPDTVGGFKMTLKSESASLSLPVLGTDVVDPAVGTYSLVLDNADHATDPNGRYAQIVPNFAKYEDITISLWVKYNGGAEWQRIFDFGADTANYMFLSPDAGGTAGLRFAIKINNGAEQLLDAPALTVGAWTYVTVTLNGNTGRLYVNGALVNTNTNVTINPKDLNQTLNYIGKSQWPDAEFNGLIDDLKIYNYARTTEQVAQDYLAIQGDWVCNNEGTVDLTFDFDGNCQVDLGDFAMLAAKWLNSNRIYPN